MNDIARESRLAWRRRWRALRPNPWLSGMGVFLLLWTGTAGGRAVLAGSGTGYLPLLGPTPIRFEVAVVRAPVALPPPAPVEPAPAVSEMSEPSLPTQGSSSASEILSPAAPSADITPVRAGDAGLTTPPVVETQVPTVTTNVVQFVVPEMLLRFFMEGAATNREPSAFAVPFNPALPPVPSSRATYTSGPPQ